MTASNTQEFKQEISQMKRRISALERAFDSILTNDDIEAIEQAHEDLKQDKTIGLREAKKKYS